MIIQQKIQFITKVLNLIKKKYVEYQEITHIQPCKVVDEFIEGERF